MTIRLKLLCDAEKTSREFVFDRPEISIGEGLFNDIVLEARRGSGIYGRLHAGDELVFRGRAAGVEKRLLRDGETADRAASDEPSEWALREGDGVAFGADGSTTLKLVERRSEEETALERLSLPEDLDPDATTAARLWSITDAISREPTVESLLRATASLLRSTTGRSPTRASLALIRCEDRIGNHLHVFEPSADEVDDAPPIHHPGRYVRQSAPLVGLGIERRDVLEIVRDGHSFAAYPADDEQCSFFFCIEADEGLHGLLDVAFDEGVCEQLAQHTAEAGVLLEPLTRLVLERVVHTSEREALAEENRYFRERQRRHYRLKDLVSKSEAMADVYHTLDDWRSYDDPVLLVGEAGSGKSLLGRALHHSDGSRDGIWLSLDCRDFPDEVLSVELFGCAESELQGASAPRKGVFELARDGTVFLDEIEHLSSSLQARLLRILKEGEVRRIGDAVARSVRARLVASTHRDLDALADTPGFRRDLYLQLREHAVCVPPLRERDPDIVPLARTFLETFADRYERPCRDFDDEARTRLQNHHWPGNVRELKTVVESAVLSAGDTELVRADDLGI